MRRALTGGGDMQKCKCGRSEGVALQRAAAAREPKAQQVLLRVEFLAALFSCPPRALLFLFVGPGATGLLVDAESRHLVAVAVADYV